MYSDRMVSTCCNAEMYVDGDKEHGTKYFVCIACEEPCDSHLAPQEELHPDVVKKFEEELDNLDRQLGGYLLGKGVRFMSTQDIIEKYQQRMGWSDATLLDVLVDYIENQQSPEAFKDYLEERAETEEGFSLGTPDWEGEDDGA